ncbi:hypothetical protein AWJ20_4208 [Sugiyamaella lignohabitans]|uniref:Regulator of free ubiquitin chains 1 n=1 Tax=Sugiyamaella lignohabitans TaxID=796027 RepID=A0A167C9K1_9ASCO|nr:uncharacterized protein AWJ20_4208 [Sugiyamaella lignohabitans]ANB11399.1 hypothetical protein AWJ20_4208 [Sugiyamaella lignohabitans]
MRSFYDRDVPFALDRLEEIRNGIEKQVEAYEKVQKEQKRLERARVKAQLKEKEDAKKKALSAASSIQRSHFGTDSRSTTGPSTRSSAPDDDDRSYLETLASLRRLKVQNERGDSTASDRIGSWSTVSYPTIPDRTVSLSHSSTPSGSSTPLSIPGAFPGSPPPVPPKDYNATSVSSSTISSNTKGTSTASSTVAAPPSIEHKNRYSTEGGTGLRTTFLPRGLKDTFLQIAKKNTMRNLETCGILCGKLNRNAFFINYLVIPEQESTSDTCSTTNEESLFEFIDENELFVLGWIHTHPTQTCFMSSIDLHTQNSYQIMLPEAVAIVCAPSQQPSFGVFRLTDPPGIDIIKKCRQSSTFHPHREPDLYKTAYDPGHLLIRDDLPFKTKDLRQL